ncbi:MAG: hypothetical protein LBI61_01100 [Puniceicoccales bacterium]|jgi:hypothetical protein|nr:hypothetical protein [Puniceicoccales bacterium]
MPEFEERIEENSEIEIDEISSASEPEEVVGVAAEYGSGDSAEARGKGQVRYALKRGRLPQIKKSEIRRDADDVDVKAYDVAHDAIGSRAGRSEPAHGRAVKKSTEVVPLLGEKIPIGQKRGRGDAERDAPKADRKFQRRAPEQFASRGEKRGDEGCGCKRGKFCSFLEKLLSIFGIKSKRCKGTQSEATAKKRDDFRSESNGKFRAKPRHGGRGFSKKT